MSDRGILAGFHSGLLSGLGALKVRSTKSMEDTQEKAAADRARAEEFPALQGNGWRKTASVLDRRARV
jgi:hypothetical protein